jgi:hypothetical protein
LIGGRESEEGTGQPTELPPTIETEARGSRTFRGSMNEGVILMNEIGIPILAAGTSLTFEILLFN